MPTPMCANCGLPLTRQVYRSQDGNVHCCRRCAERKPCRCREFVLLPRQPRELLAFTHGSVDPAALS